MYLYQNSKETAFIVDAEGKTHRIPPSELWEVKPQSCSDVTDGGKQQVVLIPVEKVAKDLCSKGRDFGLVIINENRTPTGITFDYEKANTESTRIRKDFETDLVETYVKRGKEQALQNMPIRPPAASLQKILDARGLDLLKDYGIQPVGYKVSESAMTRDRKVAELEKQNADLRERMDRQQKLMEKVLEKVTK